MPKKIRIPREADFLELLGLGGEPLEEQPDGESNMAPSPQAALQLKITLRYISPTIWRRIVVPDSLKLYELESVILSAMGWSGGHMSAFRSARRGFGPDLDLPKSAVLQQVVQRRRQKVLFEYDFGDGWLHEILVEKILPFDPKGIYPVCLAGARACPPEDCGGVGGYYQVLEAMREPAAANAELREWTGPGFDPEAFDAEQLNRSWTTRRRRRARR